MKTYKVSEIFYSFQGEGLYTGYPAVFIRFFGCNLQCNFGGITEPQNIDRLEDFVVPERGCDSGYSWMKEMEHLSKRMSAEEIANEVCKLVPATCGEIAIVYTGGEPLLKKDAIFEIHDYLQTALNNVIQIHIVETNGTIGVPAEFKDYGIHLSISPKLFSVTNEPKGIKIDILKNIISVYDDQNFILKFVLDNREESWKELEGVLYDLEKECGDIRSFVYVMPMGADFTHQISDNTESIVRKALNKGYKISLRTHIYIFKNKIGS